MAHALSQSDRVPPATVDDLRRHARTTRVSVAAVGVFVALAVANAWFQVPLFTEVMLLLTLRSLAVPFIRAQRATEQAAAEHISRLGYQPEDFHVPDPELHHEYSPTDHLIVIERESALPPA